MKWNKISSCLFLLVTVNLVADNSLGQTSEEKRIRTQTIVDYPVVSGIVSDNGHVVSQTRFNENGLTTEETTYKEDGSLIATKVHVYDDQNRLRETVTHVADANVSRKMIYAYDGDQMSGAEAYDGNGSLQSTIAYRYDSAGNLIEIIGRNPGGDVLMRTVNRFDADGNLLESIPYGPTGNVIGKGAFTYEGKLQTAQQIGMDGKVRQLVEKKLDDAGNIIEEIIKNPNGQIIKQTTNTYDENGMLADSVTEMPFSNMRMRTSHNYNKDGQLVETTRYNKFDEPVKVSRVLYEYDE